MKIKRDFVTNSSSTSFTLIVESHVESVEELVENINNYLLEYIAKNDWKDDFEPPKLLTAEEVAAMAVFLASEQARGITGQALNICGGLVFY